MADRTEPIEGYDEMTVAEIVDELDGMNADEVEAVKDYEADGKARKGILSYEVNGDDEADVEAEAKATKQVAPTAVPVTVDNRTARSDGDAQAGQWVDVVSGDHAGRRGAYVQTLSNDPADGYPTAILVRTRDADNDLIEVDYADARPSAYTGGR